MRLLAINGSPRKERNTGRLLAKIVEGAASRGVEGELVQLRDLSFTGCVSCFECKRVGGPSYGRCVIKDGLTETLDKAVAADVLVLGTPIYLWSESAFMRAFMERLLFSSMVYKKENHSLAKTKKGTALVYTMNVGQELMTQIGMDSNMGTSKEFMQRIFGHCEVMLCCDTKQFDDYSKYEMEIFDVAEKQRRHDEVFPRELQLAFELGQNLVS